MNFPLDFIADFLGLDFEFDTILIIALLLFFYIEGVRDYMLYIVLVLLLFSN